MGVGAALRRHQEEEKEPRSQAKVNLKDAGLVCSRKRAELVAGSYLLVTSSPIP